MIENSTMPQAFLMLVAVDIRIYSLHQSLCFRGQWDKPGDLGKFASNGDVTKHHMSTIFYQQNHLNACQKLLRYPIASDTRTVGVLPSTVQMATQTSHMSALDD